VSKAKQIGTRAETAVKNYLISVGYSPLEAHRNVLKGSEDEGDVWLREPNFGLIVFEVKGGKAAKEASLGKIESWWEETEREKENAKAQHGFLVTQRSGVGYPRAGEWWAYTDLKTLTYLSTRLTIYKVQNPIVRVRLQDLIKLIHG
jgi:hypothetical protein